MTFKDQQADMLEATGLWAQYPFLPLKQWDDAKSLYALGVLKDLDTGEYLWWPGESLFSFQNVQPQLVNKKFVLDLFEQGWMVD